MAREQAIRERAYRIWENEGCFHGNDVEHWLRAEAEMSEVYLLDTSAFMNLGLPVFTKLRCWHLHVSPYVFWERLCHLDETTDFPRAKGEFKKFAHVRVLDDPRATIEKPEGRVSDTELIDGALAALATHSLYIYISDTCSIGHSNLEPSGRYHWPLLPSSVRRGQGS